MEANIEEFTKYVNGIYDTMIQEEIHCFVIAEVLIARMEMAIQSKNKLVKELSPKNPELKQVVIRFERLESSLRSVKIYQGTIRSYLFKQFGEKEVETNILAISKLFEKMFNSDNNKVELFHMCMSMIDKGYLPTYIDLDMIQKQEIAKRSKLPLEYVTTILRYIPDVCINSTEP